MADRGMELASPEPMDDGSDARAGNFQIRDLKSFEEVSQMGRELAALYAYSENLDHSLFRDRTIDESVDGALRERQGGWSLMGGQAGSYTGSWQNVGTFSAVHSIGGAISHSWGNRDVAAESNQDLHDAIVQATGVVRTLNSTVVVVASHTESHQVQTHTITNHNHCHALMVQYYEVLRQLKVTTCFKRGRPG